MGLFDAKTPQQVQQDIRKENIAIDSSRGALTGWQAIGAAAYGGGRGLGQALSGPDPRMTKAKAVEDIQRSMFEEGWEDKVGTPEFFQEAAKRLSVIDPAMAAKALMQGKELQMKLEDRGINNAYKLTQMSAMGQPKDTRSTAMKKYQEQLALGKSPEEAYANSFAKKGGTNVTVNTGDLGKPAVNTLEKSIIDTTGGIDRLNAIQSNFNASYLETPNRFLMAAYNTGEKFGVPLSDQSKEELTKYSQFQQDAINNVNLYIKYITGAQMSEAEAGRLRLAVPDSGEGIIPKDGPTKFKAKLDNAIRGSKLARIRALYMRQKGLSPKFNKDGEAVAFPVSLSQMEDIFEARGKALEQSIRSDNPGVGEQGIREMVKKQLIEEFGQ